MFPFVGEQTFLLLFAVCMPGAFLELVKHFRDEVCHLLGVVKEETNDGELAAFTSYALAFPSSFLALVDTYDVLRCVIRKPLKDEKAEVNLYSIT